MMLTVGELVAIAACLCFIGILLGGDLLLTQHDIRNELRAARLEREVKEVSVESSRCA